MPEFTNDRISNRYNDREVVCLHNHNLQTDENFELSNRGVFTKAHFSTYGSDSYASPKQQSAETVCTSKKYHLSELIDIPLLQHLFCSFYELTGIMHAVLDSDNNILTTTGWHDICTKFHRICPQTENRCRQSDSYIANHLEDGHPYIGYRCLNGLMDYATPIVVDGRHLGTIFMGQLFHEPPDEEYFRCQAREFGFDEKAYLEALRKVNIVPENRIKPIMNFYAKLGQVLAKMGLEKLSQMEAAEDKFYKAFHCFPDPVTITNFEKGYFIEVNDAWVETTGYTKQEVLGHSTFELGVWSSLDQRDVMVKQIRTEGHVRNFETSFRMKSGEMRMFLTSAEILMGKQSHLLCVHKDITERKRLERKLLESEEKFSKIFYNSPDPITITTLKDAQHVEVNDAWEQITGFKRQEVIGRSAMDMNLWVSLEDRDDLIKRITRQGKVRNIEMEFHKGSGEITTALLSADIINMGGEPHLLMITKNIDDRKRMEESLRLTEERFSKAFNASPIAMSITALDDGCFIDVNDSVCRVMGCTRQEILGRTSLETGFWYDPDDRERIKQKIIENKSVRDQEIYFQTRSGERRIGLYSAERLDINREPYMLSLLMDITERKQMENEMVRLDRLNMVGEMAASIGHEIRNPLTSVRGFLQMFEDKYGEDKENLELMIDELDRANDIISSFLSLARNRTVELHETNLNTLIHNMYPILLANATIQEKTIQIVTENIPDLLIDEKEIRQLIFNMVLNGLESMSPGKSLTIRTFLKGTNVVLSIQDQGKGIDLETLNKLGTPFFTTKENGTGLGLAVCYGIASRHDAKIEIETSASGTVFLVRFPLEKIHETCPTRIQ
ncbi:MAG TPA: PAS domain S-box protein [Syntrophomonadaceae bacterium]|nr:PAS domain S-box protein [Syntrophomonadaceae bacterium]